MSPARPGRDARRAAGRLCFVDFSDPTPTSAVEPRITDDHVSGVVLFRKNVRSPQQVAALTAALQTIAADSRTAPLWVSIDHEGGAVTRFPAAGAAGAEAAPVGTPLPGAMALGAAGDHALAREAGKVVGRELRAMGITLNFAPVMDVNSNPANPIIGTRSFGEDPGLVDAMGSAYIGGLQDASVAATAKHFPGHGDTSVDSHLGLPRVDHGLERLTAVELPPFAAAVRAGVAAVMTAHIVHPSLDSSGAPATMSEPILTGLLRERMGFRGLVFTDSLSMRAIVDHFGVGDAAVQSIRAGCDIVLALGPDALQEEVLDHLARAIETGAIPDARVREAHERIDAALARWIGESARRPSASSRGAADGLSSTVGTAEHFDVAARIAAAAVTLVRDRAGVLPLKGAIGIITVAGATEEWPPPNLATALRQHGANARDRTAAEDLADVDRAVVVTRSQGALPSSQVAAVRDLHRRLGDRIVVVATGDPYDLMTFPEIPAYLVTYGWDVPSLNAGAQVLLGRISPGGRLPVSLPGVGLTDGASTQRPR
ncbi:MAG TPA: beta-N-acetylhexosaminidase [bacterium]|nr:beta-N-acetylhexosaminidase [bacterium]